MLLEYKNAVIYGGGGAVGGAVARAFAREGAEVFLAGRTLAKLEEVAEEIRSSGGVAETAQVDALDERAVDRYVDAVAEGAGGIDVSFNLVSYEDVQGTPLAEMSLEDFERPVVNAVRTQLLTARAAARHMISQGSQQIIAVGPEGKSEVIGRVPSFPFCIDWLPDGRLLVVSARYESDMLGAMVAHARGAAVNLAEGDTRLALPALRRAWQMWQEFKSHCKESARRSR